MWEIRRQLDTNLFEIRRQLDTNLWKIRRQLNTNLFEIRRKFYTNFFEIRRKKVVSFFFKILKVYNYQYYPFYDVVQLFEMKILIDFERMNSVSQ